MDRDALLNLVRFDPKALQAAIQKCREQIDALEQQKNDLLNTVGVFELLMRLHEPGRNASHSGVQANLTPVVVPDRRFKGKTHGDAAYMVLSQNGGTMGGRSILEAVIQGGLKVGGASPMQTLAAAMRRDARIEKNPDEQNSWRLKKAVGAVEGPGRPLSVQH